MNRYRTADGKATIEWELTKDKEKGYTFSAMGEWQRSCGQCLEDIAKAYPGDPMVQEIVRVWRKYHLNDMKAGTREQEAVVKGMGYTSACKLLKSKGLFEIPMNEVKKHYTATRGLDYTRTVKRKTAYGRSTYTEVVPAKTYRYGERWLCWKIPEDVVHQIQSWPERIKQQADGQLTERSQSEYNALKFLTKHGLSVTLKPGNKVPDWIIHGQHYQVTVRRIKESTDKLIFDFWGAQADLGKKLDERDTVNVLTSVALNAYVPEEFEEFCSEYGYDPDSRKAEATFEKCKVFAQKIKKFFTEEELEELREMF